MSIIEFDSVHRCYKRGVPVLRGLSFGLEQSEVVGLLGRNGAGKTTLIRIAMGMIAPQEGKVEVFGLDPFKSPVEIKRRLGYVSEDQALPPTARTSELISLHRQLFPTWDEELERDLCDRFDIQLDSRISTLSKGQARHVALMLAISHRPELLILDEPAGGLDPVARRGFVETAIGLLNDDQTTVLFSSHQMQDVERLASRVVIVDEGELLLDRQIESLKEGTSLALLPCQPGIDVDRIQSLPSCVSAREHQQVVRAVFDSPPSALRSLLQSDLGLSEPVCKSLPLEELFVELVSGRAAA